MELQDKLFRSCALANNVQTLLLKYLKEDDPENLQDLLNEGRVDVNYIYIDCDEFAYENKNALQIACLFFASETSEKCIQVLLDYGANIFYEDPDTQKNSLHFAAEGGNSKIVEVILKHISKKGISLSECNVIFTLIKYIRDAEEVEENYVKILELLLATDIDINYQDRPSGWTAVYMAAKYNYKHFIKALLEHHMTEIDLDEYKDKLGKTARDLITELKLYNGVLPEYREENSNVTIHTLFKNLSNHNMEEFRANYRNIHNSVKKHDQEEMLLRAVELGSEEAVQFIIDQTANFETEYYSHDDKNPLVSAAMKGYHKIVKILINKIPNSETISSALYKILKLSDITKKSDNVDYDKCLHILLKSKNLDINSKDWNKNTALHYALRYQDPDIALEILRKGASLASKDSFDNLAVADIDSTTMETHLNECITYENEEISGNEDACLVINLTSLLPPRTNEKIHSNTAINIEPKYNNSVDPNISLSEQLVSETEVLQYMCCSHELKQYLKHPVVLAFLYLKWHRIRMFFYVNLAIYMLFIISLIMYITFGYNNITKQEHKVLTGLSYCVLTITFVMLVLRELFQIVVYRFRYFLAFENWLELVLLCVTAGILLEQSNQVQTRQFSAVAIVTAAIEFLLLVGQFPSMSTNIMMLRTVSYTFFKLLLWYSILLIAFAYSFYTLFQNPNNGTISNNGTLTEISNTEGAKDDEEEQDFFEDPGMSLLKTIVMLTGEFDAASIKFNSYPIISQLIFVMFVFLIAIVLFNLLNGLAVSDTQAIKNDAELYGQILRVEHISHVEKVLLTNKLIRYIPKIKQICLFPLNVKRMEILVYPNQNSKVELIQTVSDTPDHERKPSCFKEFFGVNLEYKIQRAIRILMKQLKEEANKNKKEQDKLDEIVKLLNQLLKSQEKSQ